MNGPGRETVHRRDIDGVEYDAPLDVTCLDCGDRAAADFEHHYYGLPSGWEAYSPERGYRGGVVCGPCVGRAIDDVLDALRTVPEDFIWQPGAGMDEGIGP
ncbi:hypothetical protein [Xylanimonas ulmi]|uniref:Uncharacterized protein n=1 Tax=Xylanimonas ulmi TaxID=228973 RepID=A0A4Q7M2S6_9MICO|nr:hypothetical protein [Xylanibacterium ulmi]RZS62196.1 hypothetical protein EV386_2517 [Xylanibacterium ulmi]